MFKLNERNQLLKIAEQEEEDDRRDDIIATKQVTLPFL
jgi:hypothetical protein